MNDSACGSAAYDNCRLFCRSDLSKDQMIVDLSIKAKILFWGGISLGSMSVGVLGYAVLRYNIIFWVVRDIKLN